MTQKEKIFDPLKGPYTLDDIGVQLYMLNETMREMLEILRADSQLDGTTVTNLFTLPVNSPVMKIDFVEARHLNEPPGVILDVPLAPVQQMIIDNSGPGSVFIATNRHLFQREAASVILSGETRTFSLKKRAIKFLNIVSQVGQSATVRLEVLV